MARGRGGAGGVWAGPLTSPLPAAEGLKKLFSGATMASSRGMLVTVGQVRLLLGGGGIRGVWPQPSERSRRKAVGTECGRGGASSVPRPQVW